MATWLYVLVHSVLSKVKRRMKHTAQTEVVFKPSSFLLANLVNLCDQLEPIAKSA